MSPPGRPKGEYRSAQREGHRLSPPGRPKGEYRSAQREGHRLSPPGRPKGEYRSAPHEGTPVNTAVDPFHHLHDEDYALAYERIALTHDGSVAMGGRSTESLCGDWRFTLDLFDEGLRQKWFADEPRPPAEWTHPRDYDAGGGATVAVPSCWTALRPEWTLLRGRRLVHAQHRRNAGAGAAADGAAGGGRELPGPRSSSTGNAWGRTAAARRRSSSN